MTPRSLLLRADEVRGLLDQGEAQLRRVVRLRDRTQTYSLYDDDGWPVSCDAFGDWTRDRCPYGAPGEVRWCKETWRTGAALDTKNADEIARMCEEANYPAPWAAIEYQADGTRVNWDDVIWQSPGRLRSSVHMPRWASRLTVEITDVRVERVQDVTEEDAIAGGMPYEWHGIPVGAVEQFRARWDAVYAKRGDGWDSNPWVWVISVRRVEAAA